MDVILAAHELIFTRLIKERVENSLMAGKGVLTPIRYHNRILEVDREDKIMAFKWDTDMKRFIHEEKDKSLLRGRWCRINYTCEDIHWFSVGRLSNTFRIRNPTYVTLEGEIRKAYPETLSITGNRASILTERKVISEIDGKEITYPKTIFMHPCAMIAWLLIAQNPTQDWMLPSSNHLEDEVIPSVVWCYLQQLLGDLTRLAIGYLYPTRIENEDEILFVVLGMFPDPT
jgi:hypothetical protein